MRPTPAIIFGLGLLAGAAVSSGPATAAQLASGPLYGGPSEATVACYIGNVSSASIGVNSPAIINQEGLPETLSGNSCGATIAKKKTCVFTANITGSSHYCVINTPATTVGNLRGTIHIWDSSLNVLQTQGMR